VFPINRSIRWKKGISRSMLSFDRAAMPDSTEFLGNLSEFQVHLSILFWDQRALWGVLSARHRLKIRVFLKNLGRNVALQSASSSCLPEHSHRLRISSWMAGVLRQWPGPWVNIFKAFEELSSLHTLRCVRIETRHTPCKNNLPRANGSHHLSWHH